MQCNASEVSLQRIYTKVIFQLLTDIKNNSGLQNKKTGKDLRISKREAIEFFWGNIYRHDLNIMCEITEKNATLIRRKAKELLLSSKDCHILEGLQNPEAKACKFCQSDKIIKNGKRRGMQGYFCKSCNRKFNDSLTDRRKKLFELKQQADYLAKKSIKVRTSANFTGVSHSTISRWRKNTTPALVPLFSIPNGGKRHISTAKKLKKEGVKAFVPDLFLAVARREFHGLFIEMKFGKSKPSEAQKHWIKELEDEGYKVAVCYSCEQAIESIKQYL